MAVATMGRGVWERDPSIPQRHLKRPGTPRGSLRGERGPFLGGHPWVCCSYGRYGPVLRARQAQCPLGGICLWGDIRERALGLLAVGEPPSRDMLLFWGTLI